MRPIHIVHLDKSRPAVILTRESVRRFRKRLTVAAITSTERGLTSEVPVGPRNGLDVSSVVDCDDIYTVETDSIGRHVGYLLEDQEVELALALISAFDLEADISRPR